MSNDSVSPYDVEEGDKLTLVWLPYGWARDEHGFTREMAVTVRGTAGTPKEGHMWAVDCETADGHTLTVNTDNGYVTSGAGGSPFDKGRFRRFTEVDK